MPTGWEKVGKTKAPISKAIEFYMHPENLPKVHTNFVKEAEVLGNGGWSYQDRTACCHDGQEDQLNQHVDL